MFEGAIPAKQYGAGHVVVWDAGRWQPLSDPLQRLKDGHLKFELLGHKHRKPHRVSRSANVHTANGVHIKVAGARQKNRFERLMLGKGAC